MDSSETEADRCTTSTRASSRKSRVYVFHDFLWRTYGTLIGTHHNNCLLTNGAVILDVAGGKGDLSWLLMNVHDVISVVVDPRTCPPSSHLVRSVDWLQQHPDEARKRSIPHRSTHQPLATLLPRIVEQREKRKREHSQNNAQEWQEYLEPLHLQLELDSALIEAFRQSISDVASGQSTRDLCPPTWQKFWDDRIKQTKTHQETCFEPCFLPESERGRTNASGKNTRVSDAQKAWCLFQRVKLVVGFHPDQATDACIELAEELEVPVCIVPCCVFPSEFPNRKLEIQDGNGEATTTRVRDYRQLLLYLQQKHPKLRKWSLEFHETETSRNVVLYTCPDEFQQR